MSRKLYVGNLPFTTDETQLQDLFAQAGTVETVSVVRDRDTGRARGFAFVEMGSPADAEAAISALDGRELDGRTLKVSEARERTGGGGGGGGGGRIEFGSSGFHDTILGEATEAAVKMTTTKLIAAKSRLE